MRCEGGEKMEMIWNWEDPNEPGRVEQVLPELLAEAVWRWICAQGKE